MASDVSAYHRRYNRERYRRLRAEHIARMGGECVQCGSDDRLEFDHIDPSQKEYELAKIWAYPVAMVEAELAKCQLLCRACHERKSVLDAGNQPAIGTHGTLSSYRYCRCASCKEAKAEYMKEYMRTHVRKRDRKPG